MKGLCTELVEARYMTFLWSMAFVPHVYMLGWCLSVCVYIWASSCVALSQALLKALQGVSLVFHCASPAPASDDKALFQRVNIQGTQAVLQACTEVGVQVGGSIDWSYKTLQ